MRFNKPTKRDVGLGLAKSAGYHDDTRLYVRVCVEWRIKREYVNRAWQQGAAMRKAGVVCTCYECKQRIATATA